MSYYCLSWHLWSSCEYPWLLKLMLVSYILVVWRIELFIFDRITHYWSAGAVSCCLRSSSYDRVAAKVAKWILSACCLLYSSSSSICTHWRRFVVRRAAFWETSSLLWLLSGKASPWESFFDWVFFILLGCCWLLHQSLLRLWAI